MGGKGGPYRLDAGNKVYQMSDEEKKKVDKQVNETAREMAKEALRKRLAEINMSEVDHIRYDKIHMAVRKEIAQLRVVLEGLEAKQRERVWQRHHMSGDLDDRKLVEGITGEKNIYMRRGDDNNNSAVNMEKPKRLHFVMDVSGSMYRFNSQDGRLDRLVETALMCMESVSGFEHKFDYKMTGHSGDSAEIPLVAYGLPPKNAAERLKVMSTMQAHAQYCDSGDSTLLALDKAVKDVTSKEGDDYFVFVFSDANLNRYNIQPEAIAKLMNSDKRVKVFVIFIASLADEAEKIKAALPPGRGYVCLDTGKIPSTFQAIFQTTFSAE